MPDTSLFTTKILEGKKTPKSREFVVGYVGRLSREKQVNILITSIKKTVDKIPYLRLVIVGDGPERQNLKNQIEKLEISSHVEFYGEIQHHDLPSIYHTFDLCIFLGEEESFGLSHLEALSCGVPIITATTPSIDLLGEDYKNIILVKEISPENISNAILRFHKNSRSTKRIQKTTKRLNKQLSWDITAKAIEKIYAEAIKNSLEESHAYNHITIPKLIHKDPLIINLVEIADQYREVPNHIKQGIKDVLIWNYQNILLD